MTVPILISSRGLAHGVKVLVGGEEVQMLQSLRLDAPLRGAPTVELELIALDGFEVELDADVTVSVALPEGHVLIEAPHHDGTKRYHVEKREGPA